MNPEGSGNEEPQDSPGNEEPQDSPEALRAEIKKLQNRLRGAAQSREQVRLQNVYLANLQSELTRANDRITELESGQTPGKEASGSSTALEREHKELLEMYSGLEAELENEQKEYDELFERFNTAEQDHLEEKNQLLEQVDKLQRALADLKKNASPHASSGAGELQQALDLKEFQLSKEKEVVQQLQETVESLRQEMQKRKEKQYAREKTINDNYEGAMEQLRTDRQRLQLTIERLQSALLDAAGTAGEAKGATTTASQVVTLAPLRAAERSRYGDIIRHLQLELLEVKQQAFQIPSSVEQKIPISPPECFTSLGEEVRWMTTELLGAGSSVPGSARSVLDFTNPTARVVSARSMFSVPIGSTVNGYWF